MITIKLRCVQALGIVSAILCRTCSNLGVFFMKLVIASLAMENKLNYEIQNGRRQK